MVQTNFVKELKNIDTYAYNAIIEVFKANGHDVFEFPKNLTNK